MPNNWSNCRNILCVRADNMGDLIMSGPAIRALKKTFGASITVLTSSMASEIARLMDEVDDVITYDLPWVKNDSPFDDTLFYNLVCQIKERQFDAAVVFTVYSQSPLPAIMLTYLAGIPKRLAYCRENAYQLLTNWVPDEEPYSYIRHQVRRDLDLVASVGANTLNKKLALTKERNLWPVIEAKLTSIGVDVGKRWLILHPGVSEVKRQYPIDDWIETGKRIVAELNYQVVITGSTSEKQLTHQLKNEIGSNCYSTGGLFNLSELIVLVSKAPVMLSVNTGTIHIAAAVNTPPVVLYALTNPQHTPWQVPCKVLPFSIPDEMQSKNEVIKYVNKKLYGKHVPIPKPEEVLNAIKELLQGGVPDNKEILLNSADQFGSSV